VNRKLHAVSSRSNNHFFSLRACTQLVQCKKETPAEDAARPVAEEQKQQRTNFFISTAHSKTRDFANGDKEKCDLKNKKSIIFHHQ
jgi:hypothetical protein